MEIQVLEARSSKGYRKKVCAYCRVSTDALEQENSLENQIAYYENLIQSNPEYEYAGVYYDFAISGYKEKRPGLQKMLTDARNGKIDLIYTKSVSRFARNTAIVLKASRELKELNVGIFFELQNINTLSSQGELMLTILAAFAQAESESGSIGAKMVYQRKYEQGIPVQYLERCFGYTKNEKGEFVPDTEQAKWIVKIYEMAAEGYSLSTIADEMNAAGVKTDKGAGWVESTVKRILENEIYKGDYIMHKNYVNEERKLVRNRGEVDAWYIEDDHPPIVSRQLWDSPQEIAKGLEDEEIEGCMGAKKWYPSTVINILKNEKHMGDALLQKSYTADFLTKKQVKNHGEVTQVYVKGSHIGIIDKETWNAVQLEFARREEFVKEHGLKGYGYGRECNPFTSRIFCGECGSPYTRHTWRSRGIMQWQCKNHMTNGKVTCVNGFVSQNDLELGFVKAYNMLLKHKEILIPRWKDTIETGNALERLRAKQFLDLSEQPELECYVPELAQMVIQMVIIKGIKKYEFTFMDGSRETVCV